MIVCELMRGWGLRAHRAILYTHSSDGRSRMYGATVRRVHVSWHVSIQQFYVVCKVERRFAYSPPLPLLSSSQL